MQKDSKAGEKTDERYKDQPPATEADPAAPATDAPPAETKAGETPATPPVADAPADGKSSK